MTIHEALPADDPLVLASRLSHVLSGLTAWLRADMYAANVSLTQARVLVALRDRGPHRVTDLAARELVAQPSMTSLINRMERQGLVVREPDVTDGRAVRVRVTDAGLDLLARVSAAREAALAHLLSGLNARDTARIRSALPALERLVAATVDEVAHVTR